MRPAAGLPLEHRFPEFGIEPVGGSAESDRWERHVVAADRSQPHCAGDPDAAGADADIMFGSPSRYPYRHRAVMRTM